MIGWDLNYGISQPKTVQNENGYVHRSGVRRRTMHFVYLGVDFNNWSTAA